MLRFTFQAGPCVQLRRGHRRQVHGPHLHRSGQVRGVGVLRRVQQAGGADAIGGVHAGAENPSLFHSHGIPETISFMFFLKKYDFSVVNESFFILSLNFLTFHGCRLDRKTKQTHLKVEIPAVKRSFIFQKLVIRNTIPPSRSSDPAHPDRPPRGRPLRDPPGQARRPRSRLRHLRHHEPGGKGVRREAEAARQPKAAIQASSHVKVRKNVAFCTFCFF